MTLKAERQVCKLILTLLPKEVRNAVHACHSDAAHCTICAPGDQACVGTRAGSARGRAAGPGQTYRDGRAPGDGIKPGGAVSEVSSRAQSGALVECSGGPCAAWLGGGHVGAHRASGDWHRRYVGAAAGREDQGQRDLSRSGALLALAYGESQWLALALRDGVDRDTLGRTGLGSALSQRPVPLRALSSTAGAAAQDVTRVGRATPGAVP